MDGYIKLWEVLKTDKRTVKAVEYGVIAGVLVAVVIAGLGLLGDDLPSHVVATAATVS